MKKFNHEVHIDQSDTGITGYKEQYIFKFDNNYGASVIRGEYTYGYKDGLYELAVLYWDGNTWYLEYGTPITHDVLGNLTVAEVEKALDEIKALEED